MKIRFLPNGLTFATDDNGHQVAELQVSWLSLYADWVKANGLDPQTYRFIMPDGSTAIVTDDDPFNWKIL